MEMEDEAMRLYFASISVPIRAAEPIILRGLLPEARAYLETYGCAILERAGVTTVRYPTGTTSTEILPRTSYERFKIVLPDGTQLQEARLRQIAPEHCLYLLKRPNEHSSPKAGLICHPECSEGSTSPTTEILRCAQDDIPAFDGECSLE